MGRHGDHEDAEEKGEVESGDVMDISDAGMMGSEANTPTPLEQLDEHDTHGAEHATEPCCEHPATSQEKSAESGKEGDGGHTHPDQPEHSQSHGHVHHSSSWVPLTEFNETDVLVKHGSAPLSFLYYDFVLTPAETLDFRRTGVSSYGNATTEMSTLQQDELVAWQHEQYTHGAGSREEDRVMGGDGRPHPGLMILHVVSFSLAYFAVLPIVLALRAAKLTSLAYGISKLVFGLLVLLGWISGVWYKASTPDLYVGHKHNVSGNLLLLATIAIGAIDLVAVGQRLYRFATSDQINLKAFINIVVRGEGEKYKIMEEYETIALANQMELDDMDEPTPSQNKTSAEHIGEQGNSVIFTSPWANRVDVEHRNSRFSNSSEASTLRDSPIFVGSPHEMHKPLDFPTRGMSTGSSGFSHHFKRPSMSDLQHVDARPAPPSKTTRQKIARVGMYLMHFFSRGLVIWAYIVTIMGIVVYTGMGRKWFLPSLLAHLIKGSIFFW